MKAKQIKLETMNGQEAEQQENKELVKVEQIKDTPFSLVEHDNKYFLALGKYRLSEPVESKEEAEAEAKDTSWDRLIAVIYATATEVVKQELIQLNK